MPDIDLFGIQQLERPWLGGGEPPLPQYNTNNIQQNQAAQQGATPQGTQQYQQYQNNQSYAQTSQQYGAQQYANQQYAGQQQMYGQPQYGAQYGQNVMTPQYQAGTPYLQQAAPGQLYRLADGRIVSLVTQNGQLYFVPYIEKSGYNISRVEGQNVAVYEPQRKMVEFNRGESVGFSIKNYGKTSEKDVFAGMTSTTQVAQDIPVTQQRMNEAWKAVMKEIPGDQHIILSALGTSKVEVASENQVRITTISHTALGDLRDNFRVWFRERLMAILQNRNLEILYQGPAKGQEIKIMTNVEKLKTMMEKSEGLRILVEGLKLELI